MRSTLLSLISLLISCFILYLGIGLMNVLVPVRMGLEGMATETIGLVLSLYFVGMLTGAFYSKQLVKRVGHIRAFAGSVAIEAICILAFTLEADAWLWGGLRILLGFSQACLLTAMESWLSDSANEETRGKVLAVYNVCILAGLFGGQFLIGIADPADDKLFVIVGILLSLAAIPVLFSRTQGPVIETVAPMSVVSLFRISPLGVMACLVAGIVYSALFNLLPVFATEYGISGFQLSLFMACSIVGAFLLQFPVGYLSDRFDRRSVLLMLLVISAVAGLAVIPLAEAGLLYGLFILTGLTAGIIACYYPLSIAEAFDKLKKSEMVAAMGSMLLAFGIGGAIGPYTGSLVMSAFGAASLFYYLAAFQAMLALFTLYRMTVSKALPIADQEGFVMQGTAVSSAVDLDPRTEYSEPEQPLGSEAETAVMIAEADPAAAVNMARALAAQNPEIGAEVAAAVATVPGIDVMRLYEAMKDAVPYQMLEITHAIVKAKPDLAGELISQLAEWYPQQVVPIAIEVGRIIPESRVEMARIAAESAPESAHQVAEYYARVLGEEREALRPADREEDSSEEDALTMASELWDVAPEQALDIAATVAGSVPETAVPLTEEYLASGWGEIETRAQISDQVYAQFNDNSAEDLQDAVDWANRIGEVAPEQALDVAATVVEAVPESAVPLTEEFLASTLGDNETDTEEVAADYEDSSIEESAVETNQEDLQDAVEWANRITEAAPEQALDVAATVVEAVPEAMLPLTEEYLSETDADDSEPSHASEPAQIAVPPDPIEDQQKAIEWLQRMSEMTPDMSMDLVAKIVETVPESASYVAAAVAKVISEQEQTVTSSGNDEIESAVELVNRITEVAPDSAEDVAVAVVETIPEAASDVVDAISAGEEAREGEWQQAISERPDK